LTLPRTALHRYQEDAAWKLRTDYGRQTVALMGAGKTIIALTAITDLALSPAEDGVTVVVGPLAVVQTVWHREAAGWEHTKHLRIVKVIGTPLQRRRALETPADIYLINYDTIDWLVKHFPHATHSIALLIADEASCLKTPSAKRTQAMLKLSGLATRRWALTGTPRNHALLDVWGPAQFVTQSLTFPPFVPWRNAHFFPVDPYERQWLPLTGIEPKVVEAVRRFTHVVDAAALDTRPPVVEVVHDVVLPFEVAELYDRIDEGTTANFAAAVAAGVSMPHEMTIAGKLMQVCSGAIYHEDGSRKVTHLHEARLDALADIHDGHRKPTLVFVQFRHEMARILERFPFARVFDPDLIDQWNRGDIEMLVAHPASAGHGINLQGGSDTLVWFSVGWSAELWTQAIARLARQGQRGTVTVHTLLSRGRIDEVAYNLVHRRVAAQDALVADLREPAA
jgi:hypothetical protein